MGPGRFRIVGALAPQGGWTVEVALDRDRTPPRPVELAQVPPAVMSDGVTLAALLRSSELATRVVHPAVQPVLGLVEHGGGMALASAHHEGTALPALLAASGPLPAELAVRVAGQVARALEAVHGLTTAAERPLVHGSVGPEVVRVCEDGAVLLSGLGRPGPGGPADDVAALRRLLGALDPELPPELEAALGSLAGREVTAADFWRAIEAAVAPAKAAKLALWLERMAPEAAAERQARRRALGLALLDEEGEPVDEAAQATLAEAAAAPPPVQRTAATDEAPSQTGAAPAEVPQGASAHAPAAPVSQPPRPPSPAARTRGTQAEPDWFAPPTAPATPPSLRSSSAASPASRRAAAKGAPPPLPAARIGEAAMAPAPGPIAGQVTPPRPPAAPASPHPPAVAWLEDAPWRAPAVAVAALLGLLVGYLSGR